MGLARSTVQRIVAALATEDFVAEAQPGRGVRIGPGLARIAASLSSNFTEILHPHLVALRDEVGETVDLSILSGGSAVFIDQIPGQQRLVALSAIGERFPASLHRQRQGDPRVLSQRRTRPSSDRRRASPSIPIIRSTIARKLLRELEAARRKHLAFDLGEHGVGISAVGVAVVDAFGRPVAVSIPAPTHRFNDQRDSLAEALLAFREKLRSTVGK